MWRKRRVRRETTRQVREIEEGLANISAQLTQMQWSAAAAGPRVPWEEAERIAARFMRTLGFEDAEVTPPGADGGIDVRSACAVAQVKAYTGQIGRPDLQRFRGAALAGHQAALFFSVNGFTQNALAWGDMANLALFTFDAEFCPVAANVHARRLVEAASGVTPVVSAPRHARVGKRLWRVVVARRPATQALPDGEGNLNQAVRPVAEAKGPLPPAAEVAPAASPGSSWSKSVSAIVVGLCLLTAGPITLVVAGEAMRRAGDPLLKLPRSTMAKRRWAVLVAGLVGTPALFVIAIQALARSVEHIPANSAAPWWSTVIGLVVTVPYFWLAYDVVTRRALRRIPLHDWLGTSSQKAPQPENELTASAPFAAIDEPIPE